MVEYAKKSPTKNIKIETWNSIAGPVFKQICNREKIIQVTQNRIVQKVKQLQNGRSLLPCNSQKNMFHSFDLNCDGTVRWIEILRYLKALDSNGDRIL
jgi:hypothetical protein